MTPVTADSLDNPHVLTNHLFVADNSSVPEDVAPFSPWDQESEV